MSDQRGVPSANPRVVAYVLVSVGAILIAAGIGILFGIGWALIVFGVALVAEAVLLVDVPRATSSRPPRSARRARPAPPPSPRAAFPQPAPSPPAGLPDTTVKG